MGQGATGRVFLETANRVVFHPFAPGQSRNSTWGPKDQKQSCDMGLWV